MNIYVKNRTSYVFRLLKLNGVAVKLAKIFFEKCHLDFSLPIMNTRINQMNADIISINYYF